ncbi:MAG: hypothetical protein ABI691_18425 [Ginsengibacter sp.]
MKKITALLLLMILLTSQSLFAQTKDDYLLKSKHQKTAAWVMLGGGTSLLVAGGIIGIRGFANLLSGEVDKAGNNVGLAGLLDITGAAAMLGSIPLFIASSKNKRKAMSITFSNQPLPALVKNTMGRRSLPSIGLQLKL